MVKKYIKCLILIKHAAGTREFFMNEKKTYKKIFKKELIKSENFLNNKKSGLLMLFFFSSG